LSTHSKQIYQRLALLSAKINKIKELDLLDELQDLDYLILIEKKLRVKSKNLVEKKLVPPNFRELFEYDYRAVLFIRDSFKTIPNTLSLGSVCERIKELNNKYLSPKSLTKKELDLNSSEVTIFQKHFSSLLPKVQKFFKREDWGTKGQPNDEIIDYYHIKEASVFNSGESEALIDFIESNESFESSINAILETLRNKISELKNMWELAKEQEPEINGLYKSCKFEELSNRVAEVALFGDIATTEKKGLSNYRDAKQRIKTFRAEIKKLLNVASKSPLKLTRTPHLGIFKKKYQMFVDESSKLATPVIKAINRQKFLTECQNNIDDIDEKIRRETKRLKRSEMFLYLFKYGTIVAFMLGILACLIIGLELW
jgi:hypothetical protein